MRKKATQGFTLLELSIVLVIIGLIIGGVTVGNELIRQAQLQSVGRDFQKYETAINTFKLKYRAMPGDMPNAYSYWPTAGSNNRVCASSGGLNGDGNGVIEEQGWINNGEDTRAWQHLSLAQLVSGNYSGTAQYAGIRWNVDLPESRISGSGYGLYSSQFKHSGCSGDDGGWNSFEWNDRKGNYIMFGSRGEVNGVPNDGAGMLAGGAINPAEAQAIDQKLDDGLYNAGRVVGTGPDQQTGCGSGSAYTVTGTGRVCRMIYWLP